MEQVLWDIVDVKFALILENAGISWYNSSLRLLRNDLWSLSLKKDAEVPDERNRTSRDVKKTFMDSVGAARFRSKK